MPTGDPLAPAVQPAGETALVSKMVAAESALQGEPAPSSPEYRDYHRRRLQDEAQSKEKKVRRSTVDGAVGTARLHEDGRGRGSANGYVQAARGDSVASYRVCR